jgi:pimeloyl-ACP methyl ester carboxylesterase
MAATQRPFRDVALNERSGPPAWESIPSWFVIPEHDRNIPSAVHRFMAERAEAREVVGIEGASHAVVVSHPDEVAGVILGAASPSAGPHAATPEPVLRDQSNTPGTIVLIHGLWMTSLSWEHWIERYESRGFRVLAPAWIAARWAKPFKEETAIFLGRSYSRAYFCASATPG